MEPSSAPFSWAPPTSFGIDEATFRELRDLETFSTRDPSATSPQYPPTVGDGIFDAYVQELQDRRRMTAPDPFLPPDAAELGQIPLWEQNLGSDILPGGVDAIPALSDSMELPFNILDQDVQLEDFEFDAPATSQPLSPSDEGRGDAKKRRFRTPQQQEMNKLAQQRYRERRKKKHTDLEQEVETLRERLASCEKLEKEKVELVRRNKFLEKMVQLQNEELKGLRTQLFSQVKGLGELDPQGAMQGPKTPEMLRQELDTQVRALNQFLEANSIRAGDAQVSDESRQVVSKIITASCEATARLTTLIAGELIDRNAHELKEQHVKSLEPCIQALQLSEKQTTAILDMRADHLTRMRRLYEARQSLNMQTMALMLPHPSHSKGGTLDRSVSGKIDCISNGGWTNCNKADCKLNAMLDEIKENLHTELTAYFELQVSLLHHILNPVQAAMLIVHEYPELLDCLAFANTLAGMKGGALDLEALESTEIAGPRSRKRGAS